MYVYIYISYDTHDINKITYIVCVLYNILINNCNQQTVSLIYNNKKNVFKLETFLHEKNFFTLKNIFWKSKNLFWIQSNSENILYIKEVTYNMYNKK